MQTVTLLIDSREQKYKLLFPEIVTVWHRGRYNRQLSTPFRIPQVVRKLKTGDYALEGQEHVALAEHKRGLDELIGNLLTRDRARAMRAFTRLAGACKFPYLFIETFPEPWWGSSVEQGKRQDVEQAMSEILSFVAANRISLIWGGRRCSVPATRRRLGEILLRILLAHYLNPAESK